MALFTGMTLGAKVLLGASTAATVGSTIASLGAQRQAERQQKRASRVESRRAAFQNARERRKAAAQASVMAARQAAGSAAMGGTTTGSEQVQGAIGSQLASNVGAQQTQESFMTQTQSFLNQANRHRSRAGQYQALSQIPGQMGIAPGSMIGMLG